MPLSEQVTELLLNAEVEEEVLNRIDVGFQNPASTFDLASSAEQAHLRRAGSVQGETVPCR